MVLIQQGEAGEIGEQHRTKLPAWLSCDLIDLGNSELRPLLGNRDDTALAAQFSPFGTMSGGSRNCSGWLAIPHGKLERVRLHDARAQLSKAHHKLGAIGELLVVVDPLHLGSEGYRACRVTRLFIA